ncbi:hypothetical protein G9A89_016136 [Geosiphon pyriformis]|nr:hypothetical protein G9A89_016136 [Geosiphon pyriformis]
MTIEYGGGVNGIFMVNGAVLRAEDTQAERYYIFIKKSKMAAIRAIDKVSVHRICSGQVVLDLASTVKELLENSLDAKATSVEIRFKESGLESVEVIDNGSGINPENFQGLALKYHTSKISNYDDIMELETFGFRGEAISSLCALSKLTIITSTQKHAPTGQKIEYDSNGQISKQSPIAREAGTTVIVKKLFETLPVRFREFKKNIRRDYAKALTLLEAYAIICTGVRIICNNQSGKSERKTVFVTHGNKTTWENIVNLFGPKAISSLISFDFYLEIKIGKYLLRNNQDNTEESDQLKIRVNGHVSKPTPGNGRTTSGRQYYFINSRPCHLPKMAKIFNETYKSFNMNQYPFVVADFHLSKSSYDLNVSPDKRTIFLHDEESICENLKIQLNALFEPFRAIFPISNLEGDFEGQNLYPIEDHISNGPSQNSEERASMGSNSFYQGLDIQESPAQLSTEYIGNMDTQATKDNCKTFTQPTSLHDISMSANLLNPLVKSPTQIEPLESISSTEREADYFRHMPKTLHKSSQAERPKPNKRNRLGHLPQKSHGIDNLFGPVQIKKISEQDENDHGAEFFESDMKEIPAKGIETKVYDPTSEQNLGLNDIRGTQLLDNISSANGRQTAQNKLIDPNEKLEVMFDFNKIPKRKFDPRKIPSPKPAHPKPHLDDAGISVPDNEKVARELSRVISKDDFNRMEIIGQFNLGFIIAKLVNPNGDDLFIIDQHASDEKYNFETLQLHTKIHSQRLISPRPLELTAAEEMVAIENIEILRQNGFDIMLDNEAPVTRKLKLVSQPVSKNTIFGLKDLEELIFLLSERPGEMARCSHVQSMFASRACRKSVMIGDSLTRQQMQKIVKNMGQIEQPWNCPHGRPSMRHLFDLSQIKSDQRYTPNISNKGSLYPLLKKE